MSKFIENVDKIIMEYNMISKGDRVVVGISGGADSVCLIHILNKLKDKYSLTLFGAHINHCIRGDAADKDQLFVENLCKDLGIQCFSLKEKVEDVAKERGISSEMAGREIRYEFFNSLKKELSCNKVALAHNANDQAETILMRIVRGTGLEGLGGIKAVRDSFVIRPLIKTLREDIEAYLDENNFKSRLDKTNLENIYSRNKVRLELIPYLKDNFNQDIVNTLIRLSYNLKNDNEFIEKNSEKIFYKYCDVKKEKVIIKKDAFLEHDAILTRVIRRAILSLTGDIYNFERKHIFDLIDIQKAGTGKKINLVRKVIAYNSYGDIELFFEKDKKVKSIEEYILKLDNKIFIEDFNINISLKKFNNKNTYKFENKGLINYFDYDKIINGIIKLRARCNGDSIIPLGMKGRKKLKDLFIDLKIPKEERDEIPIILFGEEIAWIVGYRSSDSFKVTKDTKEILEIRVEGDSNTWMKV